MSNNPQKIPRELTLEECEKVSGGICVPGHPTCHPPRPGDRGFPRRPRYPWIGSK